MKEHGALETLLIPLGATLSAALPPQVTKDKDASVRGQDFEKAGQLRDREMELKAKISAIIAGAKETSKAEAESVEGGGPQVGARAGGRWAWSKHRPGSALGVEQAAADQAAAERLQDSCPGRAVV